MDYLALVEALCPATTVTELRYVAPRDAETAPQQILKIFNPLVDQPECRGPGLAYLLSKVPEGVAPEYMKALLRQVTFRQAALDPEMSKHIADLLEALMVRPQWEREALQAMISLDVDRRAEFPLHDRLPVFESAAFRGSSTWNRALYGAHFGDKAAIEQVTTLMQAVTSADVVAMMFGDVVLLGPENARLILGVFSEDQRTTSAADPSFDGPTLASTVELQMLMLQ